MFLKTLVIKGFKSFAETASLEMEPGVTVVVGPNGSGKSNVVDAIGWVLGAQAPSAVRSQKMDDVIFAGTAKRPALGRAEVSLTIDNSAGLLDIEFTEVTVTRTLFRNGDSEYALNGVPCRLLDIQELLSDSGVGRQQHVIVSQGQIDAVLNARPEDRRLVIEEAAGVLKFRRRKEKAERRLASTEANLTRLHDLLREVRRNLRPLEKQADAARRHGAVVAELHSLRTYVQGQELARLRTRLGNSGQRKAELAQRDAELRKWLADLDTQVLATEARLSSMGGSDLGDSLVRFESLGERARGLGAVLAERRRGIERDRGATVDQAVIASLEADSARLAAELADVEAEARKLAPEADRLEVAERELAELREEFRRQWADGVEAPSGRAAEVRGQLAALRSGIERGESEAERVRSRLDNLEAKLGRLDGEVTRLRSEGAGGSGPGATEVSLVDRLRAAEHDHAAVKNIADAADEARRDADNEHHTWLARAEALGVALDEARSQAGAEKLGQLEGVLGTLLDLVDVDAGWEPAFEAAAVEAIAAVVVADVTVARRALATLQDGGLSGAVLALGPARRVSLAPEGGERSVRTHVRSTRPGVEALLDALIGTTTVAGSWSEAVDVALADPTNTVVTRSGDRFGPAGWRVGAARSGATGAARDEARERAAQAGEAAQEAARARLAARAALDDARAVEAEVSRALDQHRSRLRAMGDALARVLNDRADTVAEIDGLRSHIGELQERNTRDQVHAAELAATLPGLEADETEQVERGRAMGQARTDLEARAAALGAQRSDLEIRSAGLEERHTYLQRRLGEVDERLDRNVSRRREAETRRVEMDRRQLATDRLSALVTDRLATVESALGELRERRRRQSEAARTVASELDSMRKQRADAERALGEVRELLQRAELDEAEVKLRIETAVEALRRDLDVEPDHAMSVPAPELPENVTPGARMRELERDLRLMGPINPLALEEFEALQERHQFLDDQLEDVKAGRRDLAKIIRSVDAEIVNVFASAYVDVAANFADLFETLFPGGHGSLKLTDPENLLDTGVEVEARPSGKNVRKLSLLSGGERSLTALAYLFAVFRARPSPFYVMDEVEAALDDVNLHRFLDLVAEFRAEAQLIIVSHQKRTMEAADILYGVTMQPGGSSRVISEKVGSGRV